LLGVLLREELEVTYKFSIDHLPDYLDLADGEIFGEDSHVSIECIPKHLYHVNFSGLVGVEKASLLGLFIHKAMIVILSGSVVIANGQVVGSRGFALLEVR
jgi:hypothetical protein